MDLFTSFLARFPARVMLFYWVCFMFPFPFDLIGLPFQLIEPKEQPAWMKTPAEYFGKASMWVYTTKNEVCQWAGPQFFGEKVTIQMTGSGDTMRAYIGCFCAAGIATGLALVWSFLMLVLRNRAISWNGDAWLHSVVRVIVRFYLMQMLFSYGFAKVFPLQFQPPNSFRLNQQLGDMSPMGLLWTFMGFSTPYQMFTGAIEVLGGLLLITRRTTLAGALVTIVAMTQIFALNMCFDVPVKLYSFHYLVMALFLAAPDMPRLFSIFILGRAAPAQPFPRLLGSLVCHRLAYTFRTLLVLAMLYGQIQVGYKRWNDTYGGPPTPVTGRWERVSLQIDTKDASPNDPLNWKFLDFVNKSMVRITSQNAPMTVYRTAWSADGNLLTLTRFTGQAWNAQLTFALPAPDKFELHGTINGKALKATFKPVPEKKYELTNRSFHWIQEMPYNR